VARELKKLPAVTPSDPDGISMRGNPTSTLPVCPSRATCPRPSSRQRSSQTPTKRRYSSAGRQTPPDRGEARGGHLELRRASLSGSRHEGREEPAAPLLDDLPYSPSFIMGREVVHRHHQAFAQRGRQYSLRLRLEDSPVGRALCGERGSHPLRAHVDEHRGLLAAVSGHRAVTVGRTATRNTRDGPERRAIGSRRSPSGWRTRRALR
jgi:hypothetical protein